MQMLKLDRELLYSLPQLPKHTKFLLRWLVSIKYTRPSTPIHFGIIYSLALFITLTLLPSPPNVQPIALLLCSVLSFTITIILYYPSIEFTQAFLLKTINRFAKLA